MTFRVNLTNNTGLRLTVIVPAASDRHACEIAEARVNADPQHLALAPWVAGFSTRNS